MITHFVGSDRPQEGDIQIRISSGLALFLFLFLLVLKTVRVMGNLSVNNQISLMAYVHRRVKNEVDRAREKAQ